MKKLFGIILVAAFAIFAIADIIHDFIANDTVHYFSEQPHQLLLVAGIGIVGGFVALCYYLLSPRLQRKAKLVALGSAASLVMLGGGYFTLRFASLSPRLESVIPHHMALILLLWTIAIAGLIWFEFYQVLKSRNHVA